MAMVGLDDPRWAKLKHAYGAADDIPDLLVAIGNHAAAAPDEIDCEEDPWHELWSSLCHQGDVYSASFAAVPHIVYQALQQPNRATWEFFALPVSIEVQRKQADIQIPEDPEPEYSQAILQLGHCAASIATNPMDAEMSASILAAIALTQGYPGVARMLIEIPPDDADEAVELYLNR